MANPTVGVIGLGFGRAHIPAFQVHGCDVVAVCQRDEIAARKIAEAHGVKGVFTRWEDLIERARPEIVVIATPPHNHLAIAEAAFARGAHVLCEKPITLGRRGQTDAGGRAALGPRGDDGLQLAIPRRHADAERAGDGGRHRPAVPHHRALAR